MAKYTKVSDSGKRQEFKTGSVRDTAQGKGRFDLISPIALRRLAEHMENGAVKYGDRNWEKGQPVTRYLDSTLRHLNKWREGHRDEDHLAAALWNIHCMIHTEEMVERGLLPKELMDNIPNYLSSHTIDPVQFAKAFAPVLSLKESLEAMRLSVPAFALKDAMKKQRRPKKKAYKGQKQRV